MQTKFILFRSGGRVQVVPATKANWALLRHYAIADAFLIRVDVRQLDLRKVRHDNKVVTIADAEKAVITAALSECKTKTEAAAQLGINKSTLAAKIKKYGLDEKKGGDSGLE